MGEPRPTILTVGHSTRSIDDFLALLAAHRVELVADVRSIPRSRKNPQFDISGLPAALAGLGIGYVHLKGLGGLRRPRRDSPNIAWRNASFRGYADYMGTASFEAALDALIEAAGRRRTCILCAEAVPWRCHRSLIADALAVRGLPVEHIFTARLRQPHAITPFARIDGKRISYPEPGERRGGSRASPNGRVRRAESAGRRGVQGFQGTSATDAGSGPASGAGNGEAPERRATKGRAHR